MGSLVGNVPRALRVYSRVSALYNMDTHRAKTLGARRVNTLDYSGGAPWYSGDEP